MNIIKNLFSSKSKLEILQDIFAINYSYILHGLVPEEDNAYFTEEFGKDIYKRDIYTVKLLKSNFICNYFDEISISIKRKSYSEIKILDPFFDLNSEIDLRFYVRDLEPTRKDFMNLWKILFEEFGHKDVKLSCSEIDLLMKSDKQIFAEWKFDSNGDLVSHELDSWCTFKFLTSVNLRNNIYKRPVLTISNFNLFIKTIEHLNGHKSSFEFSLAKNEPVIFWEEEDGF